MSSGNGPLDVADFVDVGVVIPARDAAAFIGDALESVLAQRPRPREIVVVDDGSTDGTHDVVGEFGEDVRIIELPPSGPAAARNRGIASLTTEFVAFLDADDLWTPNSLAPRLALMQQHDGIDCVVGGMRRFTNVDAPRASEPGWVLGTLLARRSVFSRFGALPEHRRGGDFMEWVLVARRAGARFEVLDLPILLRREHESNLTRVETDQINVDYLGIVRAELARKRAAQTD